MTNLEAMLSFGNAASRVWDAVVVGAGPAGAMAAYDLARRGASTLLVDKASFPRRKVCGSCFNELALTTLSEAGLGALMSRLNAQSVHGFMMFMDGRSATIPLSCGMALSREVFDAALVGEAIAKGCAFLPQTYAASCALRPSTRSLMLRQDSRSIQIEARVVLVADGLGGNFLQNENGFEAKVYQGSRIGVNAVAKEAPDFYTRGTIFMACAKKGYVGLVRLEDAQCNIAAALDPEFLRQEGNPGRAVAKILQENRLPHIPDWENLAWRGTPELTRRRDHVAAERLFVLGDAAGYVEPFTGEGIAWAMVSALRVVPLAMQAIGSWDPRLESQWAHLYSRLLRRRQKNCRGVARILRQATLTRFAVRALAWKPALATPYVRFMNAALR